MRFCFFLLLLLYFYSPLDAKIVQAEKLEEVLPHIDAETLVVLDLDDTLIVPKQMLGGDCWFRTQMKTLQEKGFSMEESLAKTLPDYFNLQHCLEVLPVQTNTAQIVQQFQQKAGKVIGLTTRSPELAYRTIQQLKSLDIDLSLKSLSDSKHDLDTYFPHAYIQGILFTQSQHKGEVLHKLCKHLGYIPKKVIFVNDKYKYVMQLEETFSSLKIPYIGFRYAACDPNIEQYDPHVAEIQLHYFDSILSNEDAAYLMQHSEHEEAHS